MIDTMKLTLPAPAGEEPRKAYIYLPDKMKEDETFPVMYLFDGQTAFFDDTAPYGESMLLGEFLKKRKTRMIVVSVEADKVNRMSEYSPFAFTSPFGNSTGYGKQHLEWLTGVFKPRIDECYPTKRDRAHTMIAGSSLGGLMALYAIATFPDVFSAALAFSPSLWVNRAEMARLLEGVRPDSEIYFDYGEKELTNHAEVKESLQLACNALFKSGAPFAFRLAKGAVHNEAAWKKRLSSAFDCFEITRKN